MYSVNQFSQPMPQMNASYTITSTTASPSAQRLQEAFMPTTGVPTSMWNNAGQQPVPMYSFDTNSNIQQPQNFQQASISSTQTYLPAVSTYTTYPQVQNPQITTPINLEGFPPITVSTPIPSFQFKPNP